MKITGNTVLITGGATGIGLEMARSFLDRGNTVIICGRRIEKLEAAKALLPGLSIHQCDVGDKNQRRALFQHCMWHFPAVNILVNNAGMQREINFLNGEEAYENGDSEVEINLEAPLHLSALFLPHLLRQQQAAIINVSSGLGFVPLKIMPVYCATKAALHSFSISLRQQLKGTFVKVFELIPPIVDTDLDRGARAKRGQVNRGIPVQKVAVETINALEKDQEEIAVGMVKLLCIGSRIAPHLFFKMLNTNKGKK
jgi:uncharacterized oxidoreductase